jgi:MFS family permease
VSFKRWRAGGVLVAAGLHAVAVANGVYEITLGSRVTDMRSALQVGVGEIGVVASAFPAGLLFGGLAMVAMSRRWGTRPCVLVGSVLCFAPLIVIGWLLAHPGSGATVALLAALWAVAGFGCGLLDPAHGTVAADYSDGYVTFIQGVKLSATAASAVFGLAAIAAGVPVGEHFMLAGAIALLLGLLGAIVLPNVRRRPDEEAPGPQVGFLGLSRLGLVAAASIVPLGAAFYWATTILEELGAPRALKALGLVGFALLQVAGLSTAFRVRARIRPERLAGVGMSVAAAGACAIAAVAVHLWRPFLLTPAVIPLALAGFALLGMGIAPLTALAQQAAYNVRVRSLGVTTRIGAIVNLQYLVQGGAPAAVGLIGEVTGVTAAFAIVTGACMMVLPLGRPLLRYAARQPRDRRFDDAGLAPQVAAAVRWWADRLRTPATTPRGEELDPLTLDEIDSWARALGAVCQPKYALFGGWLNLRSDLIACGPLKVAADEAGVSVDFRLPAATWMRIRTNGVWVGVGEGAKPRRIWSPASRP